MEDERRIIKRHKIGYYMPVIDDKKHERIGHLSDISPRGFKLDSQKPLKTNKKYTLRLDLSPEIADKPYIVFAARAIWGKPDPISPNEYIQGFKIINISPGERDIFQHIVDKYATP
jgi:hypothetical protein